MKDFLLSKIVDIGFFLMAMVLILVLAITKTISPGFTETVVISWMASVTTYIGSHMRNSNGKPKENGG
jgi:hypothetical protein